MVADNEFENAFADLRNLLFRSLGHPTDVIMYKRWMTMIRIYVSERNREIERLEKALHKLPDTVREKLDG